MKPEIVIRNETHDDVCAITEVTIAAFKTLEISNHTEQFIIEALRAAKAYYGQKINTRYDVAEHLRTPEEMAARSMPRTTGEAIRMLRELKGWTQEELARRSGINAKNISMLENDRIDIGKRRAEQPPGVQRASRHHHVPGIRRRTHSARCLIG